ncbi:MerC domain-containing protein [Sphingorhabdus pulchriflava]|uniref:MerC domain-containing protein n=1 Tax=Sphingorhabdus pulchriflava TaxID=2292257 RepID=A0A371B5B4_9SPHN|nr:MerC domain-containing protein [Sphingorhabdus pulchriflava]RDV02734.1 MerC domain-containing protein [Sphingorhabdus pulchriflava]
MIALQAYWREKRWDGLGLSLAGLCLVHCLATSIMLALLASAGGFLFSPIIHEAGLGLAIVFGIFALVKGMIEHGFMLPAAIGSLGIGVMSGALTLPHGGTEIVYTMVGVAILALGHDLNLRASR